MPDRLQTEIKPIFSGVVCLSDMITYFFTHKFIRVLDGIRAIEFMAWNKGFSDEGNAKVPKETLDGMVKSWIDDCRNYCQGLEIKPGVDRIDKQLIPVLEKGLTYNQLQQETKVIRDIIDNELGDRRFVYLPRVKAGVLDSAVDNWKPIWDWCNDAKADIREAVEAYVLGLNTCCVFQSMRVSERGLRRLAAKLKVKITDKGKQCPLEYGTWDKVLTAIKNRITKIQTQPLGPKKQAQLSLYADAADHCVYMKDIWRNEVSHTRKSYNDPEALGVLNRVHDFMAFLAKNSI